MKRGLTLEDTNGIIKASEDVLFVVDFYYFITES